MTMENAGIETTARERNRLVCARAGRLVTGFVIVCLGLAGSASAQDGPAACRVDTDCKLIYSSCSCVAVASSDPRTFLPANIECAVNRCRMEHTRATCQENVCEPASKDATRPPRHED